MHVVLLPPPVNDPEDSDATRVFFWNRLESFGGCEMTGAICSQNPAGYTGVYGRGYSLNLSGRGMPMTVISPPGGGYDDVHGSQAPFCAGQTLLEDGSLLIVGGTDRVLSCTDVDNPGQCSGADFGGSTLLLRLDTSVEPPFWDVPDPTQLPWAAWYPSAITLEDGSVFVAGHDAKPFINQRFRQIVDYDPVMKHVSFAAGPENSVQPATCTGASMLYVIDYPRLHLLKSGDIIDAMSGWNSAQPPDHPPNPDMPYQPRTRFFDRVTPFHCGANSLDKWVDSVLPSTKNRFGGNSVHFIPRDPIDEAETVEVIYAIGGGDKHDESNCGTGYNPTASVERMLSPEVVATWDPVASLNYPRMNHVSTILLDGSVFVAGGEAEISGTCEPVLVAERYRTPEVFGSGSAWSELAPQALGRRYHSAGVLLPDGRVLVAGGRDNEGVGMGIAGSEHTLEIFSPPYMFGARPKIKSAPTTISYGDTFPVVLELTAPLGGDSAPDRVALIRLGTSTHAWDSGQRYVELDFEVPLAPGPYTNYSIDVSVEPVPEGGYMLPPGYYLLTVSDEGDRPSVAEWVLVQ